MAGVPPLAGGTQGMSDPGNSTTNGETFLLLGLGVTGLGFYGSRRRNSG